MALHAGDSITAIKGNREICYCAGESSSGWQGCRELLRPGNLLRGIFITHFLPLLLGCEAVAAGLCVILRGMQLWFAGRSRSGAGEVMLGDTISHGRGHNLLSFVNEKLDPRKLHLCFGSLHHVKT